MTTKTATDFGPVNSDNNGSQRLYRLDPPMPGYSWGDEEAPTYAYVVVSAATVLGVPETYIFGANLNGENTNWSELNGSFQGALDHEQALRNAGYGVVDSTVSDGESYDSPLAIEGAE